MTMEVDLPRALATLLREVLEGPAETGAYVLNRGDKGLLASLDALSAEAASAHSSDRASVAAHVDHLRYGLELLNRWARGADPWSTADYSASWQRVQVTEDQWTTLRDGLKKEAHDWLAYAVRRQNWDEQSLTKTLTNIMHLNYHLNTIRQISSTTKNPRAHD